jgi:hypothetical protein
MVKGSGSCLGFGQRVAGDTAAEGGLVLVRYVDVEGADLGRAVDACRVDLRLMDARSTTQLSRQARYGDAATIQRFSLSCRYRSTRLTESRCHR